MDFDKIAVIASDVIGFLKSFIEEVMTYLGLFEKHYQFEEDEYLAK